jgi:hypothetical protein
LLRSTRRLAQEIRRYCAAHPNACDTIEGISWWVQMQRQEDIKAAVGAAVERLVAEGLLQKHQLQDGSEVFGCSQKMPAE